MRTFLPGIYVVNEVDKRRCTLAGQVREWVFGFGVAWGVMMLMLMVEGWREQWWMWMVLVPWVAWFWLRNGWVEALWEELEDEERAELGPPGAHKVAKRAEWLWGLLLLVMVLRMGILCVGGWDVVMADVSEMWRAMREGGAQAGG
jgi:hypothetical protein